MKHTLEVDGVMVEFDAKRVLQDVYLKTETGKITGILGRNGSGKTCLMNVVFGVLETNNKSIRIDGEVVLKGYRNSKNFRYLPQFHFIPKNLTIKRIFKDFELDFPQFINAFPEFEKFYKTNIHRLSGGECRIIEIYSILMSKTKFCMLDEPFSQIMPLHVETLKSIILGEKKNKGIIITDHLYEHVTEISDDVYIITNGKTYLTKEMSDLKIFGYTK